jgi:hypothetical protein
MKVRLSASYTLWMKVLLTLLLFAVLLATDVYGSVLRNLPDIGEIGEVVIKIPLFIFLCYKLVDFILKERKVVEFDEEYVYIITKKDSLECLIPLYNVLKLNMRPVNFRIGNYNFNRYNLYYTSGAGTTEKQSFFIRTAGKELQQFINFTKQQNPDFRYKNWTHSFDFFEKKP